MSISEHLNKNKENLHHAYLIESERGGAVLEVKKFCEGLNIKTTASPDFIHISIDNFKIDEAFSLRAMSVSKSFTTSKKIFIVCANTISLDAQNVLLKMFEEPIENTHFFLIVPDVNVLLKTIVSRFYLIKAERESGYSQKEIEKFISMPLRNRIEFIKELLSEEEADDDEENKIILLDSVRSKAIKFLNALELFFHKKPTLDKTTDTNYFDHIFRVREFLRMPGSSTKNLMESIALIVPNY